MDSDLTLAVGTGAVTYLRNVDFRQKARLMARYLQKSVPDRVDR